MAKLSKIGRLLKKEAPKEEEQPTKKREERALKEMGAEKEVDVEALGKIVGRMREKYISEGVLKEEEVPQRALERKIRGIRPETRLVSGSPKELTLFENPFIRLFGRFYLILQRPISALSNIFYNRFGRRLELDLLSSNSKFSIEQYLSLIIAATMFIWFIVLAVVLLLFFAGIADLLSTIALAVIIPLLCMFVLLKIPSSNAMKRANQIDRELPFALRHMSIEIRAGVGIYKTLESVGSAGYGALSEDIKWVLSQVEKGVPTEDALEKWAERTRSDALKRVVSHFVRALRTGGNLSEIMITIAEDVSFERRMKIADFAEKLNLLGLFLLMVAIVFPVMITILTTISSSPSIQQYLTLFTFFSPQFLFLVYFFITPALIGIFIYFVRASDPGM